VKQQNDFQKTMLCIDEGRPVSSRHSRFSNIRASLVLTIQGFKYSRSVGSHDSRFLTTPAFLPSISPFSRELAAVMKHDCH